MVRLPCGCCYGSPVAPIWMRSPATSLGFAALMSVLPACGPKEPPRWAQGGAQLAFAEARWDRESGDPVEIRRDGKVLIDGDLTFVLDRVGRVTDEDYEPYAVLLPDGQLAGQDNVSLGRVGVTNASPPGAVEAWLSVAPDGRVTYYDSDGERSNGGVWRGCAGPMQRTCTLVAQLIALQNYRGHRSGVGVGIGVGVGVGVGF
jgi:hypothetical protein